MYLRSNTRQKDGKAHRYWSLVETVRTPSGPRQRTLCYLGELNDPEQTRWQKTIEVFNEEGESRQLALLPAGGKVAGGIGLVAKKVGDSAAIDEKRRWIEPNHKELSIVRQCDLTGLARSSLYYEPVGDSAEDLELMRLIDELYTQAPYYGSRKITFELNPQGRNVNRKDRRREGTADDTASAIQDVRALSSDIGLFSIEFLNRADVVADKTNGSEKYGAPRDLLFRLLPRCYPELFANKKAHHSWWA